jgi:tetratricopeptide (TPR) repeat protein
MGKYEDAVKFYLRAIELHGGSKDPEAYLACCYTLMGKREEAREILDDLIEYSKGNFVSGVDLALICAALGEKEQAFDWLEKAFRERDPYLLNMNNYHRLDSLRSDPRFSDLLRRIGLDQ